MWAFFWGDTVYIKYYNVHLVMTLVEWKQRVVLISHWSVFDEHAQIVSCSSMTDENHWSLVSTSTGMGDYVLVQLSLASLQVQ